MKDKRGDDCNEWKGMSDLKGVSSSVRNDVNWETTTLLTETSSSRCRSSAAINASTCTQTDRYKQADIKLRYQHIHVTYTHTSTQILQLLQTSQSGTVQDLSGVSSSDTWKTSSISRQHRHWPSFAVASRLISSGAAFHDFTVLLSCPRSDMSLLTR